MKKKFILPTIIITLLIILLVSLYFIFFNPFISISLKGKNKITLEVNNNYQEQGAIVKGTKNKYKITGNVNTKKIGKYTKMR